MAIADTINSMYENVGEVYDTITNVDLPTNKNIENIPSTIRKSYLDIMNNGIDTIYDNWEKVNGTGTSLTLNNTEEAPMTIEYKGNTSQETTTGKNLFIPKPNNSTGAGITYSLNEDGTINLSGTSTNVIYFTFDKNVSESNFVNGNTYTFSSNKTIPSGVVYKIEIRSATSWLREYAISNSTPTRTFTIDLTDAVLIRYDIQINNGTTPNLTNVGIQIESGSSATTFEPYTNGASPNPNYPQDIHIVSGDNYINVCGKNLYNINLLQSGTKSGITLTKNIDGSVTINGTATSSVAFESDNFNIGENYKLSGCYGGSSTTYKLDFFNTNISWVYPCFNGEEVSLPNNAYGRVRIVIYSGTTVNNVKIYPMLSTIGGDFQPYQSASYPINLGVENLSPISSMSTTNGGYINSSTGQLGNVVAGKTYTLQFKNNSSYTNQIELRLIHDNTYTNQLTKNLVANSVMEYTFTASHTGYLILSGKVASDITNIFTEIKTTEGSNIQYITDSPIELCKIGTYQDRIFKSSGKNLFDKNTITSGYRLDNNGIANGSASNEFTSDFIEVKSGETYIRNYGDISAYTRTCFYDKNKSFVSKNDDSQSFTIPDNVKYIRFSEYLSRLDTMQFEKGSSATPYEPYGKDWYLNKQIGKVVLNGSETWDLNNSYTYNVFYIIIDKLKKEMDVITTMSNYYKGVKNSGLADFGNTYNNSIAVRGYNDTYYHLYISNDAINSVADFKTWLSTHNTLVYYVLNTPTYEKITGELLNQLEAIKKSYENQTNINQENNDLPFELEVGALEKY